MAWRIPARLHQALKIGAGDDADNGEEGGELSFAEHHRRGAGTGAAQSPSNAEQERATGKMTAHFLALEGQRLIPHE